MTQATCAVPGCERPIRARGWCTLHYTRWRKTGDVGPAQPRPRRNPTTCTITGCKRRYYGHGYCQLHMRRWKKTGDPGPAMPRRQERGRCTFVGCGLPQRGKGLCGGHYRQRRLGKPLAPLRTRRKSTIRDGLGRKLCTSCEEWRAVADFYPSRKNTDSLTTYCKRCDRDARLRRSYGITLAQYEAMLAEQAGVCAICRRAPQDGTSLHIDHDHSCCPERKRSCGLCLRGLLCEDCNRVLGTFRDDITRFEAAITYLKEGS